MDKIVTDAAGATKTQTTTTTYRTPDSATGSPPRRSPEDSAPPYLPRPPTYDPATGDATKVSAAATAEKPATSATTGYDDFGRTITYTDADEATGAARNQASTVYDANGRVHQATDAHTTLTYGYNQNTEHRSLTTSLAVSVNSTTPYTGTYTAAYDPDGQAATQTDPKGIRADLTRDETGELVSQVDTNTTDGTTWMTDQVTGVTIHGQWTVPHRRGVHPAGLRIRRRHQPHHPHRLPC